MNIAKPYIPVPIAQIIAAHTPDAFVGHFAPGSGLSANAVASQLWLDQWRTFLRVDKPTTEIHYYNLDRAGVPFNLANFRDGPWSGQQMDPSGLSPENTIFEVCFREPPHPFSAPSEFMSTARALINAATGETPEFSVRRAEHVRIYPFWWLIAKLRENFPGSFLNPRLVTGPVHPMVRAALFLKGELPISFTKELALIHGDRELPVALPWHDLSHLAAICTHHDSYFFAAMVIQAAFWVFPEEVFWMGEVADHLNQVLEANLQVSIKGQVSIQDYIDHIAQAALAVGVDVQTVDRFRSQTALN